MSQVIKGYLGVFLVLLLMMSSIGILSAFMIVVNAQDLHANIVDKLENSACANTVIEECFDKAKQAGYGLSVCLFYEDGTNCQIASEAEIPANSGESAYARVELEFPLQVGFFQVDQDHRISGYVR